MKKNRIGLQFKGFDEYAEKLERLGGDLKSVTERALQDTHRFITPQLHNDMKRHRKTGQTEKSIDDHAKVEWQGTEASIGVGFSIRSGGLPSIFLMYGTPRMPKDTKLYNDIYGSKTRKEIAKLQEKVFAREIRRRMGG